MSPGRSEPPASPGLVLLRVIAPSDLAAEALALVEAADGTASVVALPGASRRPAGDLILADVTREDASLLIDRLRQIGVPERGSIAIEHLDGVISAAAVAAEARVPGASSDAVVWEQVEASTSEAVELSPSFLAFMTIATLIAAVGIFLDSPILIVGAMIVGPEFGPLAGICVALVEHRGTLVRRSLAALAAGFPWAIALTILFALILRATDVAPDDLPAAGSFSDSFASPDTFSVIVAFCAGIAGTLSLATAKSSVLIGVVVSVTTIPAAANAAVAIAYGEWGTARGSLGQLGLNLALLVVGGTLTLVLQRAVFGRGRRRGLWRAR